MKKMRKLLPTLLLAVGLALSLPLMAQAQCGGGSMNHGNMGSSGMMGGSNAPAGTWSQPAAPGNTGSGQMGNMGTMDHSQMGHGGSGTGQ